MAVLLWCSVELHAVLHRNIMKIQKFSRAVLNTIFCSLIFGKHNCFAINTPNLQLAFFLLKLQRN